MLVSPVLNLESHQCLSHQERAQYKDKFTAVDIKTKIRNLIDKVEDLSIKESFQSEFDYVVKKGPKNINIK